MIVAAAHSRDPRDVYKINAARSPDIAAAMLYLITEIDLRFPLDPIPCVVGHTTLCFCENGIETDKPIASVDWKPHSSVYEVSVPVHNHFAWDNCEVLVEAGTVDETIDILMLLKVLPKRTS